MAITDAKILLPLPAGAFAPQKSDGSRPANIYYMPAGANLVTNGSFESNATGWESVNSGTIARTTPGGKVGSAYLLLTRGSGGEATARFTNSGNGVSIVPGAHYFLGAYLEGSTGAWVSVQWRTSAGAVIVEEQLTARASSYFWWSQGVVQAPLDAAYAVVSAGVVGVATDTAKIDGVVFQAAVSIVESPVTEPTATGSFAGGAISYQLGRGAGALPGCRLFDMGSETDITASEANFTRIYGAKARLTGHALIENGLVRFRFRREESKTTALLSCYVDGAWQSAVEFDVDTDGDGATRWAGVSLVRVSPSAVTIRGTDFAGNRCDVTMRRGVPFVHLRVYAAASSAGSNELDVTPASPRQAFYNAKTLLEDTVAGTTASTPAYTEPYILTMDAGTPKPYLVVTVFPRTPTTTVLSGGHTLRYTFSTYVERQFFLGLVPFQWMRAQTGSGPVFRREAESGTLIGTAATEADAGSSGGSRVTLTAQNDEVRYEFVAGQDVPLGDYTILARALDTNQVASDFRLKATNVAGDPDPGTGAYTLTGSYAYYSTDISLDGDDAGDTIRVRAIKDTATANTIRVDYVMLVPRKRNSGSASVVLFPRDLARGLLMSSDFRETVRRTTV